MQIHAKQLLLASIAAAVAVTDLQADVNFASWGGDHEAAQQKACVDSWDGQVLEEEWPVLLTGAPNRDQASEFLVHAALPEQQAALTRCTNFGPMWASAIDIIRNGESRLHNGKEVFEHLPNRSEVMPRTIIAEPEWWVDYGSSVDERYAAWTSSHQPI